MPSTNSTPPNWRRTDRGRRSSPPSQQGHRVAVAWPCGLESRRRRLTVRGFGAGVSRLRGRVTCDRDTAVTRALAGSGRWRVAIAWPGGPESRHARDAGCVSGCVSRFRGRGTCDRDTAVTRALAGSGRGRVAVAWPCGLESRHARDAGCESAGVSRFRGRVACDRDTALGSGAPTTAPPANRPRPFEST
jgi:G:T-mismatch repair DNA endonuclease (very short patch repair protein)